MKNFFNTKHKGEETATIAEPLCSVFITEADWIEIGRMKRWQFPDTDAEVVEEIPLE